MQLATAHSEERSQNRATTNTISKIMRPSKLHVLFAALAIAAFATLPSNPAHASAFGCNGWKGVPTPWGTLSANSYCASLNGTGTYVSSVSGSFTVNFGTVCNYNITAEFFDSNGNWYYTKQTPVRYRCDWGTVSTGSIAIGTNMRRGSMCSTLKQNGARLTSVCHSIN